MADKLTIERLQAWFSERRLGRRLERRLTASQPGRIQGELTRLWADFVADRLAEISEISAMYGYSVGAPAALPAPTEDTFTCKDCGTSVVMASLPQWRSPEVKQQLADRQCSSCWYKPQNTGKA